jgi:hypothetical protein
LSNACIGQEQLLHASIDLLQNCQDIGEGVHLSALMQFSATRRHLVENDRLTNHCFDLGSSKLPGVAYKVSM